MGLQNLANVIIYLDSYSAYRFEKPEKIEEEVASSEIDLAKLEWARVKEDVAFAYREFNEKIGSQSIVLDASYKICIVTLLTGVALQTLPGVFWALNFLNPWLRETSTQVMKLFELYLMPYSHVAYSLYICAVAMMLTNFVGNYHIRKKLDSFRKQHPQRFSSIKEAVQKMIILLADKVRLGRVKPMDYKLDLNCEEYRGVKILTPKSWFGRPYCVAVPSVLGAITSRATKNIDVFDPLVNAEVFSSFRGIPKNIKIRLLASKIGGGEKKFVAFARQAYLSREGNFNFAIRKGVDEKKESYMIIDEEIWELPIPLRLEGSMSVPARDYTQITDKRLVRARKKDFNRLWKEASLLT